MPAEPDQILSEEAVREIAEKCYSKQWVEMEADTLTALCYTVRALNKTISELREEVKRLTNERNT